MATPVWVETADAWRTEIDHVSLGRLEVLLKTDGPSSEPTDQQLATLEAIASLPASLLEQIPADAQRYAEGYLPEDEYDDLEEEDFRIRFHMAIIPHLRDTADHFFFLIGSSDIDEEHGVACVVKNHDALRVCHGDSAHENYRWDDTFAIEALFD